MTKQFQFHIQKLQTKSGEKFSPFLIMNIRAFVAAAVCDVGVKAVDSFLQFLGAFT
jgi:hypothetical protein